MSSLQCGIEISMYPLRDDFIDRIDRFIDDLKKHPSLEVIVQPTSTQIYGEFSEVWRILHAEMKDHLIEKSAVFVLKVIGDDPRNYGTID